MPTLDEVRAILEPKLAELAGEASMCWDPPLTFQRFDGAAAAVALERTAAELAEQLARTFAPAGGAPGGDLQRELENVRRALAGEPLLAPAGELAVAVMDRLAGKAVA